MEETGMATPKVTIIIPSLNPDQALVDYVRSLINNGFCRIIIVNDGSKAESADIFLSLEEFPECIVLKHDINRGKGRALKTAIQYYLTNIHDSTGIITVDADGQHSVNDVLKISNEIDVPGNRSVFLGSRDFDGDNIPAKSKFGNKITSFIIKVFHGHYFSDTQTGLRGFPNELLDDLINKVHGERYEYEMNVLLYCIHRKIDVKEIQIETIYHDLNNSVSHFRPVADSARIYAIILKSFVFYSLSGLLSALLDLAIFTLVVKLFLGSTDASSIFISTVVARVCSSIFNYILNRQVVFQSKSDIAFSLVKYYFLCVIQLSVSAGLVYFFHHITHIDEVIVKALIDGLLFFISFQVQKRWVFRTSLVKGGKKI